jgi:TonB family protein
MMMMALAGCATAPRQMPPEQSAPPPVPAPGIAINGVVSSRPVNAPAYPSDMLAQLIEGSVDIECLVTLEGRATDCVVLHSTANAFEAAALDYVAHAIYRPKIQNGVAVAERHKWTIAFKLR